MVRPRAGRRKRADRDIPVADGLAVGQLANLVRKPARRARAGEDGDLEPFGEAFGAAVVVGIDVGQRDGADLAGASGGLFETPFEGRSGGITGINQHELGGDRRGRRRPAGRQRRPRPA